MLSLSQSLPDSQECRAISELLSELLIQPSEELKNRPSHRFRAKLVEAGVILSGGTVDHHSANIKVAAEAIESLHLGSLIVDDIQDGSETRRKSPALHTRLGTAHALSVGNWLYFQALKTLDRLEIAAEDKMKLQGDWISAMECAHYGQVMDIAAPISKLRISEISSICRHTALYKTGCITGLALAMGARLVKNDEPKIQAIKDLGCALGVYLQNLNDVGNMYGAFDDERRFEDLKNDKPSFVWPVVLELHGIGAFEALRIAARKLPDLKSMHGWMLQYPIEVAAKEKANEDFAQSLASFLKTAPDADVSTVIALKDRIQNAYA